MSIRAFLAFTIAASLALLPACDKKPADGKGTTTTPASTKADPSGRCPHEIKQDKCPFCNPGLVESEGFCGEHGVAEAICAQCRPYLKAAFRSKADWCNDHNLPKSQCATCNPELKDKVRPGQHGGAAPAATPVASKTGDAANCEHGIAKAKCPFCTPAIVQSNGFCKEHNVAEALCVQCRPYLETAFKAKGDWCKEHSTPESQCVLCNPELKPKGQG